MAQIQRIPSPSINRLPPPVVTGPQFQPPSLPSAPPIVDVPSFEPITYEEPTFVPSPEVRLPGIPSVPVYTPPTEQELIEQAEEAQQEAEVILPDPTAGRAVIEVPIIGEVPLPKSNEVALAGTTAIAATAAALIGKSMVEMLVKKFKPLVKKIILKIKDKRNKRFTDYELQLYFELEGKVPEQKVVAKQLGKELKAEKQKQLEAHLQRQHLSKR